MSRPKTNTVEYFPHTVDHGKTMFILERKYGVYGYNFWYKLLEKLGKTENHFLDLNDPVECEHIRANASVDEATMQSIMDTLSTLEAIDKKLWKKKIVWCQNFVDGISAVYINRHRPIPTKPITNHRNTPMAGVSTHRNPPTPTILHPVIPRGSRGSRGEIGEVGSRGSTTGVYPQFPQLVGGHKSKTDLEKLEIDKLIKKQTAKAVAK